METVFESKRINFVKVDKSLVDDYLTMINDPEVYTKLCDGVIHLTREQEEAWVDKKLENNDLVFSMIDKETGEYIGNIEIMEIKDNIGLLGITMTPAMQNKKYGREAIQRLLEYAYNELKLDGMDLTVFTDNDKAIRCYLKSGFKIVGMSDEKNLKMSSRSKRIGPYDVHISKLHDDDRTEMNGKYYILDPKPELGFNFPIAVLIPNNLKESSDLILTNLTPGTIKGSIEDAEEELIKDAISGCFSSGFRMLSSEYGNPLMIPLIPRPSGFYPGYLGKPVRDNNFEKALEDIKNGYSVLTPKELEKFIDVDKQVIAMIKYVKEFVKSFGTTVDEKIVVTGYSATAKFANQFAALHNDLVKMVIAGGTGGLGILPYKEMDGYTLEYPIGIADVPEFDINKFRKIRQLYYIGDVDYNDPSLPRCEYEYEKDENGNVVYETDSKGNKRPKNLKFQGNNIPAINPDGTYKYVYDENGDLIPPMDRYNKEQVTFIHKAYSPNNQERFLKQGSIYAKEEIDATFVMLPGDHHTISRNPGLNQMICSFYEGKELELEETQKKR